MLLSPEKWEMPANNLKTQEVIMWHIKKHGAGV